MKIKTWHVAVIVPAVFTLGIGGSMALNLWSTESSKVPEVIALGDFAGEYNPGDIRGSYTFQDIAAVFNVSVEALARAFGVDTRENPETFRVKEIEDLYGVFEGGEIGTDSVRYFTSLYTGIPYVPEDDTFLLTSALPVLKERLPQEMMSELRKRSVSPNSFSAEEEAVHVSTEERLVKGFTTFGEVYSWGVSEEEVAKVIGVVPGKRVESIRDYVMAEGIEFSSVKGKLQELVDSKEQE